MLDELPEFESTFDCDKFIRLHSCSSCWNILQKVKVGKIWKAQCEYCGDKTFAYVSKSWISRRIQENATEYAEAKYALRDALPWMKKSTRAEIMKELGF